MRIYDISMRVEEGVISWPGDADYRWTWTFQKSKGASCNVGQMSLSFHTGTHVDAPYHFTDTGTTIEGLDLDAYIGPARVLDVRGRSVIRKSDLTAIERASAPRVLLRTDGWVDRRVFPECIPTLDTDVPAWLGSRGVVLLGVDVPSVDQIDSKELPIHHALNDHGIRILENIVLTEVPEGEYELIALPLRLVGADGCPVRAILRQGERT
jgi:arylformamidase